MKTIQQEIVQLLAQILNKIASVGGGSATAAKQDTGNATLASIDSKVSTAANQVTGNSTLSSILTALQSTQEFEQNLVVDTGGVATPTYLQIRIFNSETHTFNPPVYYDAAGNVVVPVGPLELVNPQTVLQNILVQETAINGKLPTTLGQKTMATSLAVVLSSNQSAIPVTNTPASLGGVTVTKVIDAVAATSATVAGAKKVKIFPSSDFTGTIAGDTLPTPYFETEYYVDGYTVNAIPYTITTGSLTITYFN